MCANCVSAAEVIVSQVGLAAALVKDPLHRALANAGFVTAPDPVRHEVCTVAFLRSLDLDPVEILGARVVDRADARVAAGQPVPLSKRSRRPIGSHNALIAQ